MSGDRKEKCKIKRLKFKVIFHGELNDFGVKGGNHEWMEVCATITSDPQ
jgi:hypothetical protein